MMVMMMMMMMTYSLIHAESAVNPNELNDDITGNV